MYNNLQKMAVDSLPEIYRDQPNKEKPPNVRFQTGLLKDGRPEYMVIPYEKVVAGDLTYPQALDLLRSAEFGIIELRRDLEAIGRRYRGVDNQLISAHSALMLSATVYKELANIIGRLPDERSDVQQRELIANIFGTNVGLGLLNVDLLTKAVGAEYMRTQCDEKERHKIIARNHRLQRLGFLPGFNGTITGFQSDEKIIEFPYINDDLPREERWLDVAKRAEENGFIFDEKGRVFGFKTKDGRTVNILEADRVQQIKTR